MSLTTIIYAYLIGGLTFIPLLVVAFIYLHPISKENEHTEGLKAAEVEENLQTGPDAYKQGWIIVTNEHLESPDHISASTQSVAESQEGKSAYSSLYKLVKNSNTKPKHGGVSSAENTDTLDSVSISSVNASATGSSANGNKNSANKKHRFYAVLKHGNLFLYKNEKLKDVKHVIVLSNYIISIWPRGLSEALLFTKYSSIAILRKDWSRKRRLSDNVAEKPADLEWDHEHEITIHDVMNPKSNLPAPPGSFFVYTDVNIDKEDWYFALIRACKTDTEISSRLDPKIQAKSLHFETNHMISLIQTLYSSEGQLQTKWLNALLGRVFLSLRETDSMKNYLVSRLEKKLNKMKIPGFLEKFQITKVRAGRGAPFISFPVLKEINPEGDLLVSLYMHYIGEMSIQIATKVNINLGSRFKPREVDVLLSMTLEKLEGPMLVKVKPPPSARIWYTFEREPLMSVKIEPVISSRQMSYTIITNSIEKKLKDAVKESLVLPHWDDFTFYLDTAEIYRGGVWDKKAREEEGPKDEPTSVTSQDSVHSTEDDSALAVLTDDEDSISAKSEVVDVPVDASLPSRPLKLTTTLSDFSKRLRKGKSSHTLGVDETNCLSDGSLVERSDKNGSSANSVSEGITPDGKNSSIRKLGKWYYKDTKDDQASIGSAPATISTYNPPQMILNRRTTRKKSTSTLDSDPDKPETAGRFSYDFGKEVKEADLIARSIDSNGATFKTSAPVPITVTPMVENTSMTPGSFETTVQPSNSAPRGLPGPPLPRRDDEKEPHDESSIAEGSAEGTPVSPSSETARSLQRSDTFLHRKPPPPGPVPQFPPR